MLFVFLEFCAAQTCIYSITASEQLRISSYNLTKGQCVEFIVPNSSYYNMVSVDRDIEIARYVRDYNSNDYILEFLGRTPEASLIDRTDNLEHRYVYTALSNVNFSIVYGSMLQFKCEVLVIDSHNPFHFSMSKGELSGVTCALCASPGAQSIDGTLGDCESCPTIDVWDGNTQNIVHLTEAFHFTEGSRHPNLPLVVVITPHSGSVSDFESFSFRVHSNASSGMRPSRVVFGSVLDLIPPEPQVLVYEMGNCCAYVSIAVLGCILVILIGASIKSECRRKKLVNAAPLLSASMSSRRFMGGDISDES